jgi:hypothetical protein
LTTIPETLSSRPQHHDRLHAYYAQHMRCNNQNDLQIDVSTCGLPASFIYITVPCTALQVVHDSIKAWFICSTGKHVSSRPIALQHQSQRRRLSNASRASPPQEIHPDPDPLPAALPAAVVDLQCRPNRLVRVSHTYVHVRDHYAKSRQVKVSKMEMDIQREVQARAIFILALSAIESRTG